MDPANRRIRARRGGAPSWGSANEDAGMAPTAEVRLELAQPPRAVWLDYEGAEGLDDLGLVAAAR